MIFLTMMVALAAAASATPVAAATSPPAALKCMESDYRRFDFWIGSWDVVNTRDGTPAGKSLIEKLYRGCAIRENWSEPGYAGGSLNTFNATDQRWHQTWTDSKGTWREFVGGFTGARMVLVWKHPERKDAATMVQERMTFTPNPDGTVRQYCDESRDGVAWVERYDYTYRPHVD